MENENKNEMGMTDYQFKVFLNLIYEILDTSKDLEEAKNKIKNFING